MPATNPWPTAAGAASAVAAGDAGRDHRAARADVPARQGRSLRLRHLRASPARAGRRRGDPWWTPLKIEGLHKPLFTCIAGEDAVQALVLAFRFAESILPDLARRAGGEVEWLGERSRLILGPAPAPPRANGKNGKANGKTKPRPKPRKRG